MAKQNPKNSQYSEDADHDYQPSTVDNNTERPSTRSRPVTRSTTTQAAAGPQNRDNEEAQGELSDGANDVIFGDNDSDAPYDSTADNPQVPNENSESSKTRRERKCGPTAYCGVYSPRKGQPKKYDRDIGDFHCPNCDSRFTRPSGVNYHFAQCAKTYGNPHAYKWNDHASCQPSASKGRGVKKQSSGPSSANPSGGDTTARTQPATQPADLPTGPQSRQYPGDFPTGPRATRSSQQHDGTVQTQPATQPADLPTGPQSRPYPSDLPTGPRVTRSRPVQRTMEARSDSGIRTRASSTSRQAASEPSAAQRKPTRAKPGQKQPSEKQPSEKQPGKKQPGQNKKRQPRAKDGYRQHIDESLPPLSDLPAIFGDMNSRALEEIDLAEAMKVLPGKRINVATMCSGTESPLLALDMIQKDLRLRGMPALNIKHQFSAEIVPSKQAYIERNFHPNLLFRDIREIAQGGQAHTAYGALADVPPDVDMLVAGFSCVDFSRLNKNGKKLTDLGESGDTFRAVLQYAKRYRPLILILENVDGAPWDLIKAVFENERESAEEGFKKLSKGETDVGLDDLWDKKDPAYSAAWHQVDAKRYYIPQTRIRKYMVCLDRRRFPSREAADKATENWRKYMTKLERPASVSVEAFLLSEDDPRLQCAKDELSKVGRPRQERDWEVCNGRHEDYRMKEKLGILRPILNWTNDGSIKPSSYLWTDWSFSQVERIWDSIEISYLRNAVRGYDSFFKTRFWELSQNIDRFQDFTPAGVIGCIVPHGTPFSTIRGGPVTGLEAIALQGLPIDVLLLTRENERELYDFAGNAMTSTCVGAAILSALIVSHKVLTDAEDSVNEPLHDSGSNSKTMRDSELQKKKALHFDGSGETSLEELCSMAKASIRLCHCEGQSLSAPALIRKCKSCHHYCCEKCGNKPTHGYELLGGTGAPLRIEPQEFRKRVRDAVPTRLEIDSFSSERLEDFAQLFPDRSEQDWRLFKEAILLAFKQEYRYESIKRSNCWKVTYDATHSRLELVFDQEEVYWLLYGKPGQSEPGNSPVRRLLGLPLARLTVKGRTMRGERMKARNMLGGCWEIRLPMTHKFSITVTPQGQLTDSWEKKLGLQGDKFIDKQVYTSLCVAYTSQSGAGQVLDHDICGDYDLLENCGTASSSLHKKRPTANAHDAAPFYVFLDADRMGPPDDDCYVFSTDIQQLEYGESRYVAAQISSKWRPPHEGSLPRPERPIPSQAECTVFSRWEPCPLSLRPHEALEEAYSEFPKDDIWMPVFGENLDSLQSAADDVYGCLNENATTALLSCGIPGQLTDSVGWQVGHWKTIDQRSERQIAAAFAWLFARVKDLGGFEGGWRSLGPRPKGYQECLVCAPKPPKIMWASSRGGTKNAKIIPYEDGREAGDFERRIKARPAPFLVQTYIEDNEKRTGRLLVGLHLPTLVHRALARIGNITDSDELEIDWRLDTRWEAPTRYKLREFTLTNNKLNLEADYAFPTGEQLRPEQKRSLRWMIGQEADDMAFYEEEIEEAILSQLDWRAEARVRRNRVVRGGILADEVGYGKTATTLALIDAQEKKAEEYAENKTLGCISVKATLILMPPHLVHQWIGQARKFLGLDSDDDRILVIEDVNGLARTSVLRIKQAVIIIASWRVISSPAYMARMSHFAALPQGPSSGEREIDAWLTRACGNIEKHMGELASGNKSPNAFAEDLKSRLKAAYTDEEILRDVPTQRLKGAKYVPWNPAACVTPVALPPEEKDLDKFVKHLKSSDCKDLESMTGILLHMFDFYRIVVDEYTYVDEHQQQVQKLSSFITNINARSRWVLSGTPSIQDFGEVRNLASFLAYNLGVVDDAAGVLRGATIRRIREDRTAAESFRAFGYSHTAAWHMSRQAHAQRFLDKYASKNVAEIGVIKSALHLRPHFLGADETILNAELQQQLQATELRIVLHGKGKADNDRLRRYKELLKGCKTASECLLRSCSNFELEEPRSAENELLEDAMDVENDGENELSEGAMDIGDDDENELSEDAMEIEHDDENELLDGPIDAEYDDENGSSDGAMDGEDDEESDELPSPPPVVSEACEALISIRETQMQAMVVELKHNLLHAEWLEQQCARAPEPELQDTKYRQWKSEMERIGLRDPTATSDLRYYLSEVPKWIDADTEEIYYRDKPTRAQLNKEKKLADELKEREKAKRTADRQAKNSSKGKQTRKVSKVIKFEDGAEFAISDGESIHSDDMDPIVLDPRPNKIGRDDFGTYASELRKLTGHLRSLASELTSRTRSLRFARGAQELCQWLTNLGNPSTCECCGEVIDNYDDISINIRCGHLTCKACIQTTKLICAVDGCGEGSESYRLRNAMDLVGDGKNWPYGAKLGNIIALINSLPEDEQVLLFVQFEDVMLKMAAVLKAAKISNYALSKKAAGRMTDMMNDFQENDGVDKKRVLLLNPSSETAAGINLTNANHIIFASPLLTKTQQSYNASMTQCIGRAKRYGQQKTVHVYRFAALKTIDVDILQEREQKVLVKKKALRKRKAAEMSGAGGAGSNEDWLLVREDEIDDTVEAGWGSGYDFKSNPNEED